MNCNKNEKTNGHFNRCLNCRKVLLVERTRNPEFCCQMCCNEHVRKNNIRRSSRCLPSYIGNYGIKSGTVGAISELIVSVDLMKKGYDVFRAISPSCPCDLLILNNGELKRVEVRTARRAKIGDNIYYPINKKDFGKFDIIALVIDYNFIIYKTHEELSRNGRLASIIKIEYEKRPG